jgi:hypothetical protein
MCDLRYQICGLLADADALVVESPIDGAHDLHEEGFRLETQRVDNCTKTI